MGSRFMITNLVNASTTVMSATGSQGAFPVSWIKDQGVSKVWRSPVGWTVYAGFNDKIDFTEAAVARVGTLTPGTYATGATMATAVQTAMNAAPGATNTYTVTYNANKDFTITRATGSNALVLKCAAGAANFAFSVYPDLGSSETDRSGSTTYTLESPVYQSRHAIFIDLVGNAVILVKAAAVVRGSVLAIFTVQGSDTNLTTVGARATTTASQQLSTDPVGSTFSFSNQLRYWRLIIDSRALSAGYSEVPNWFLGTYSEPSVCTSIEFNLSIDQLSTVEFAKGGAHYQDQQAQRRVWDMSWLEVVEADRLIFEAIQAACPLGKNFFLSIDSSGPGTYYGFLRAGIQEKYIPHPYWSIPIAFSQAL